MTPTEVPQVGAIPVCGCTNEALEQGETCKQPICPNYAGLDIIRSESERDADEILRYLSAPERWLDAALEIIANHYHLQAGAMNQRTADMLALYHDQLIDYHERA